MLNYKVLNVAKWIFIPGFKIPAFYEI